MYNNHQDYCFGDKRPTGYYPYYNPDEMENRYSKDTSECPDNNIESDIEEEEECENGDEFGPKGLFLILLITIFLNNDELIDRDNFCIFLIFILGMAGILF